MAHTRDVVQTYRYLRGAMVGLLLALLLSVVLQWWLGTDRSCWLGSISAYYFTPARTVVVGTLCALGIALIAYEGHSPEENVLLDFSGFMALLVAAVPTVPDPRCGPSAFDETTDEIAAGIAISVPTLVVVARSSRSRRRCHPRALDARRQRCTPRDGHRSSSRSCAPSSSSSSSCSWPCCADRSSPWPTVSPPRRWSPGPSPSWCAARSASTSGTAPARPSWRPRRPTDAPTSRSRRPSGCCWLSRSSST